MIVTFIKVLHFACLRVGTSFALAPQCRDFAVLNIVMHLSLSRAAACFQYNKAIPTDRPTYAPTHPPTYLPTHPSIYLPIYLPTHPSTYLSTHPSDHPAGQAAANPPTHLPTYDYLWNGCQWIMGYECERVAHRC